MAEQKKVRVQHAEDDKASPPAFQGEPLEASKEGGFLAPIEALEDLKSHGFELVQAKPAAKK